MRYINKNGRIKSPAIIKSSITKNIIKIKILIPIKKDFRKKPKIIEKRTNPFLYSFFNGLNNVEKSKGTENKCRIYELSLVK